LTDATQRDLIHQFSVDVELSLIIEVIKKTSLIVTIIIIIIFHLTLKMR